MSVHPCTAKYADEIRAWLLGRLAKRRTAEGIERAHVDQLPDSPVLSWWLFEGRRYDGIHGPLCANWQRVVRQATNLLATHNPEWRTVDAAEGEVDWVATALHRATSARAGFVAKATRVGLGDAERQALCGWLDWVVARWRRYVSDLGAPDGVVEPSWQPSSEIQPELYVLRRWAHTARRSRWPLLRNVVASSLRCLLEPEELDRLPLPADHPTLFELVCMIRVLRALYGTPGQVRWLSLDHGDNRVDVPGMRYYYQRNLGAERVLAAAPYDGALQRAIQRHGLRVHRQPDGLLRFDRPRAGLHGILLEAKSGSQVYEATVHQLLCYRAALRDELPGPVLVWGIVEAPQENEERALAGLRDASGRDAVEDIWLFTSADRIPDALAAVGLN